MGFRFRDQIKIFPGVKINLANHGFSSVTLGGRGAAMNIPFPEEWGGRKGGTRTTLGLTGTGLSYTTEGDNIIKEIADKVTGREEVVEEAPAPAQQAETYNDLIARLQAKQ